MVVEITIIKDVGIMIMLKREIEAVHTIPHPSLLSSSFTLVNNVSGCEETR